jgi:FkbM family methyltransferase
MIYRLKKILQSLLPKRIYLKVMHIGFRFAFQFGFLKNNYIYKYHYFAHKLINKGDTVLDIGANLGYYSYIFSKLIGNNGKLVSVEPVPPFFDTLQWALKGKTNCIQHHTALGNTNETIEMFIPTKNGFFNTGLAHVPEAGEDKTNGISYKVPVNKASELFSIVEKIDFIKCDIEGYEEVVIPEMIALIKKHLPILQIETWGKHKDVIFETLTAIGYNNYSLYQGKLVQDFDINIEYGDFLFVHQSKAAEKLKGLL